jgi:hypothetical protein
MKNLIHYVEFPSGVTVIGLVPIFTKSPLTTASIPDGTPINSYLSGSDEYPSKFVYTITESGDSIPYNIYLKVFSDTITSIAGMLSESFTISPNPASGNFKVTKSASGIEIYNSLGVKVFKTEAGTSSETSISTTSFSEGVYYVKVKGLPIPKTLTIK